MYAGGTVTITGSNFIPGIVATATVCGTQATACTVQTSTQIAVVINPSTRIAKCDIQVAFEIFTLTFRFVTISLLPTLQYIRPTNAYASSIVTVFGNNFLHESQNCSGTIANAPVFSCRVLSASQLVVVLASNASAGSSSYQILFSNPSGLSVDNLPGSLIAVFGAPSFIAVTPVHFFPGSMITLSGTSFIPEDQQCTVTICSFESKPCSVVDFAKIVVTTNSSLLNGSSCSFVVEFSNPKTVNVSGNLSLSEFPVVTDLVPRNAYPSSTLTLTGARFYQGSQSCLKALVCNTAALACTFQSDSIAVVVLSGAMSPEECHVRMFFSNPPSVNVLSSQNVRVYGKPVFSPSNPVVHAVDYPGATIS
jgi:hypothetical protein